MRWQRIGALGSLAVGPLAKGRARARLSEAGDSAHLSGIRHTSPNTGLAAEAENGEREDDETEKREESKNVGYDASDTESDIVGQRVVVVVVVGIGVADAVEEGVIVIAIKTIGRTRTAVGKGGNCSD